MYRTASNGLGQYQLWRAGHLSAPQFGQLQTLMQIYSTTPAARDWWEHQAPDLFEPDFLAFVRATHDGRHPGAA